jgi:hypothetical protein
MSTPATYREYAAECLRATQRSSRPEVKAELIQLAQRWTDLAGRAEQRARAGNSGSNP